MSKNIKSYAEKHKFGCLDKSKKTKKVSKPKANKNSLFTNNEKIGVYVGGFIKWNTPSEAAKEKYNKFINDHIYNELYKDDPFGKKEYSPFNVTFTCNILLDNELQPLKFDVIQELEYLSMQLYDTVDIERFITENPDHISRYVSLDKLNTNTLYNEVMKSMILESGDTYRLSTYTDRTPLTKDVLLEFLHDTIICSLVNNEDITNMVYSMSMSTHGYYVSKAIVKNMTNLISENLNRFIDLYKEYKTRLNTLTLRDICFFIYGIKGLQLFDTLQVLGIDHCSFEFWNSIKDGILLESTTNLINPEPLPEFEFDFNTGGLL